ncbi:MAG: bacteriohemerythrin [Magnetococcales bacterium]|nr:bacteriohemerythrin [Magnetococcales bacterium]
MSGLQILSIEKFRDSLQARLRDVKVSSFHQQHLALIDYIAELYGCVQELQRHAPTDTDKQTIERVIGKLKGYVLKHFQEEEEYMHRVGFVGLEHHVRAHRRFVESVLAAEQRIWRESVTYVVELLHLTVGWLFDHINNVDMLYTRAAQGEQIDPSKFLSSSKQQPKRAAAVRPPPQSHRIASPSYNGSESMLRALEGQLQDVGVPRFNQEHKQLLNQILHLHALLHDVRGRPSSAIDWQQMIKLFDFLWSYTKTHFRGEEEAMQRCGFPGYEQHRQEHQKLLARLTELYSQFQAGPDIGLAMDLLFFLIDWFMSHTATIDFKYKTFFQQNSPQGTGVQLN